jgi:hypothetical protein
MACKRSAVRSRLAPPTFAGEACVTRHTRRSTDHCINVSVRSLNNAALQHACAHGCHTAAILTARREFFQCDGALQLRGVISIR